MTFSVRVVDAQHRPGLYAEIERDNALVAEVVIEAGQARVSIVDEGGAEMWEDDVGDLLDALKRAKQALAEMGLS